MKNFKFLLLTPCCLLLTINIACTTKYTATGNTKVLSEKTEIISYSINKISEPTAQNPYLVLNCKANGNVIKTVNEEFQVKRQVSYALPILTSAAGLFTDLLLSSNGYVVLGRNIGILGIGSSLYMLAYNHSAKPGLLWKQIEDKIPQMFIPSGNFTLQLKGTDYSSFLSPDKEGNLMVNILDYSPFYQEGKPFYLKLLSPDQKNLGEFSINTEPIASLLAAKPKIQKYPPALSFTVSFDDSTGDKDFLLDAEESGRLVLLVKNMGKGIARDLEIRITPSQPIPNLNIPSSTKIDMIGLMEEKRIVIPIDASREVPTAQVELKIEILEPYFQADAEPKILKFKTRKFEPPDLVIYDKGVEEGEIVPGKSSNISLIIQNQGAGRAEAVRGEIKVPQGITYLGEKSVFDFGTMEPKVWQRIDFPIFVGARFQAESLKIILTLNEKRQEFSKAIAITFPLNRPIQKPKEIVVKGEAMTPTGITPPPILTVDVDINIPESKMENPDGVAVIIAEKSYEDPKVPDVEYADNDGKILKEYLKKTLGYKEENIIFIENAKKSDFERVFGSEKDYKGELYNYLKPQKSDVFIYYTGHGAPDIETKSGYFVPVDCHPDYVRLNGYALETFYKNLLQIPAKSITVVIDACFSGASESGMLIAQASPLVVTFMPKEMSGNLNLFTSSGPEEISSWYPEKRHSLFTYYFLKALQGEGDKNKDKAITLGELKEYVSENVSYWAQRLYNRKQTPTFRGDENMVILRLR